MAIDWNRPIRQKNGRAARVLGRREHSQGPHPWFVEIQAGDDCWTVGTYTRDGRYIADDNPNEQDLENIPETITRWVNIWQFERSGNITFGCEHTSHGMAAKQEAPAGARKFALVQINATEGEGL